VIDLHSHILPGVDDGPESLGGSLSMARAAVAGGTTTIAATPHLNHVYPVQPGEIPAAVAALNAELRSAEIDLEVVAGGEIAITRLIDLDADELAGLGLGGGPYLLCESPLATVASNFEHVLLDLRLRGHEVLLAHPERSAFFQRAPERLQALVDAGVLCSITAASMAGQFGETVRRFTLRILADGLVHDVASDAHDHRRRPPNLLEGFEHAERDLPGILEQADWYTRLAPAAILAGEPLPERPEPPRLRRLALRLPWHR